MRAWRCGVFFVLPLAVAACGTESRVDDADSGWSATGTSAADDDTLDSTSGFTTAATSGTTGSTSSASVDDGVVFDVGTLADAGGGGIVDESTCEKAAESLTSAGCLFAPLLMQPSTHNPWAVVAANTNVADAHVILRGADGAIIEQATVAPGELHTFVLQGGSAPFTAHNIAEATGVSARAMKLESDVPVVAYQFSPYSSSQNATSDASLLLPDHAWGEDYLVGAFHNDDNSNSWITIVSFTDDNVVEVTTPSYMVGSTSAGGGIPALAPGQSTQVTIHDGDVLRILSPAAGNADLTGGRVASTAPVAVFTGAPSMSIPGPGFVSYKDHLEEQMPPRTSWGTEYAVVHFRPRSTEEDVYRFVADKDDTVITLSGDYADVLMLDEGEFAEVRTTESFYAQGNSAFAVFHYMVSTSLTPGPKDNAQYPGNFLSPNCASPSNAHTELGDPAISFIPPVDQYRYNYTFLTPETYAWDMITVIAPMAGWNEIVLDGAALPEAPTSLGVAGLGYARFFVDDGPHDIRSETVKFGLEVYGYDCRVSYAYPGGLSLAEINPPAG
jgi:hypothetical protein